MSTATIELARKIAALFAAATNQDEYREALRKAKRLPREVSLEVVDELRYAAFRLDLDASTGLAKRRVIKDRKGRSVPVEVVS